MSVITRLSGIMLDCADPAALAEFYAKAAGWTVTSAGADSAAVDGPVGVGFQRVEGYRAPGWPDQSTKQFHFDFVVEDVAVAVKELTALGATVPEHQPGGDDWTVLADPAGHLFCVFTD